MCTVILGLQTHPNIPFFIAANRDEQKARPTAPFGLLEEATEIHPAIFGGRDLKAQGTWFALRQDGAMAALTNIRPGLAVAPNKRSRGEICINLLKNNNPEEMVAHATTLDIDAYNPFNVLWGKNQTWYYLRGEPGFERKIVSVAPGLHVLGNLTLDHDNDTKTLAAQQLRNRLADNNAPLTANTLVDHLKHLLKAPPFYVDHGEYGTVWSLVCVGSHLEIAEEIIAEATAEQPFASWQPKPTLRQPCA